MSSFIAIKLDICASEGDSLQMRASTKTSARSHRVTKLVRRRIKCGGERIWRFDDFRDLSFSAVAQALSRLTREGVIERLSKGIYYRNRETAFGKSRPNPAAMRKLAAQHKTVFPSGITAANLLGFTTQNPKRSEVATVALSLPRRLIGSDTLIHTRRPAAWAALQETDAALLDFLRHGCRFSDLGQEATLRRLRALLSVRGRLDCLLEVSDTEPPRVRAMLGALGEWLGVSQKAVQRLRVSLNPLSRFDFGLLAALPNAYSWQASVTGNNKYEAGSPTCTIVHPAARTRLSRRNRISKCR